MNEKKEMTGKFGAVYQVYYGKKLIAIVTDFDEGFTDHIRDLNVEIKMVKIKK